MIIYQWVSDHMPLLYALAGFAITIADWAMARNPQWKYNGVAHAIEGWIRSMLGWPPPPNTSGPSPFAPNSPNITVTPQ